MEYFVLRVEPDFEKVIFWIEHWFLENSTGSTIGN